MCSPATGAPATVTDEMRYLFDLQGFLVVPGVLDSSRIARMNAALDGALSAGDHARDAAGADASDCGRPTANDPNKSRFE